MYKVLILYKSLPQYRLEFFNGLREELLKSDISLQLIYGDADYKGRNDSARSDWGIFRKNKYIKFGKTTLIWQPCLKEIKTANLVVVEQADKLLINYVLMMRWVLGYQKFSFWGHGLNLQAAQFSAGNIFKRLYINKCDSWFAYTNSVKSFLIKNGYAPKKISVVNNAIDTKKMHLVYNSIEENELELTRQKYGIHTNEKILIYCGALYKEKRLKFLIAAIDILVQKMSNIKLIIMGGGPDANIIENAVLNRNYLILTGPKFGREKALFFKLSVLSLMPGLVGLGILDSFAYKTPIVTTKIFYHSPEIEYLKNNINGIMTENNLSSYTESILEVLSNPKKYHFLSQNCVAEIANYNNEVMIENFVEGIKKTINF